MTLFTARLLTPVLCRACAAFCRDDIEEALKSKREEDYVRPLSVLFNAFIMMQIFNEICSRRIEDEYDFFAGLYKSPIFIGVLIATFGLQAIIMNFMGLFFKVRRWELYSAEVQGGWASGEVMRCENCRALKACSL